MIKFSLERKEQRILEIYLFEHCVDFLYVL